ncbi:hypothetical protein CMI47_00145 [Candidatus Pacearchaeota archaeon]|jgi:hypothetical protein|nr:hypothetical protein [Candidatus Pacearchaeota archaeon]|tara:strand:+ start:145 stop:423 length:279 start_codon:yes stop_codon:yes gene_type:complete
MTILEIMERTNARDTKLVTAFVKDAIMKIQSSTEMETKVNKQDITKNVRDYDLPVDMVAIYSVSVLDTEDDNKYKKIRRLAQEPNISEDTNP